MSGGTLDVRDLDPLAQVLARSAEDLENSASTLRVTVDAGASTGAVMAAMSALSEAMSAITLASAKSADLVQKDSADFRCTETDNAGALRQAGGGR